LKRKKKKTGKYRGQRTHGHGNVKNRRGKGNKGGKGRAGSQKHKRSYFMKYERDTLGSKGFKPPRKRRIKTINLFEINSLIEEGKLKKEGGKYSFPFNGKILGRGEIHYPVRVKAKQITERAKQKITAHGGEIVEGGE